MEKLKVGDLEIVLREGTQEDRQFVYQLMKFNLEEKFRRYLPEGLSDEKFDMGFKSDRITILEHEGVPIGFLDLEFRGEEAWTHNLHVSREYEGRFIGMAVLRYMERMAVERGAKIWRAKVFKENYRWINMLVERAGAKIIADLPEEHSYILGKDLEGTNG